MEGIQKRQVAYNVCVGEISQGDYVKESGWLPNYILIRGNKVSRVNIIGVVVNMAEQEDKKEFLLEDSTGRVAIRSFETMQNLNKLKVGDIVKVVGRPREFNDEKYIVPEIVKEVNKGWFELRSLELGSPTPPKEKIEIKKVESIKDETLEEKIVVKEDILKKYINPEEVIKQIKLLDKGDGADYESILEKVKDEKLIQMLLEDGEIFEIKPGKLKIL